MTTLEFKQYKDEVYKQYECIRNQKPYLTEGQIILNIIKEEFPSIVQKIKKTIDDPMFNKDAINEIWIILEHKLIFLE